MSKFIDAMITYERRKNPNVELLESSEEVFDMDGEPCRGVMAMLQTGEKYSLSLLACAIADEDEVLSAISAGNISAENDEDWVSGAELRITLDEIEAEDDLSETQKDFLWRCRKYLPVAATELN